jgi:hypothetical protein
MEASNTGRKPASNTKKAYTNYQVGNIFTGKMDDEIVNCGKKSGLKRRKAHRHLKFPSS